LPPPRLRTRHRGGPNYSTTEGARRVLGSNRVQRPLNVRFGSSASVLPYWLMVCFEPERVKKSRHSEPEGQSGDPAPRYLDFDLLRYRQSIVNIDAQIPHGAFNLGMSKKKLDGSQISGPAVD
jgi:hypothetical protein